MLQNFIDMNFFNNTSLGFNFDNDTEFAFGIVQAIATFLMAAVNGFNVFQNFEASDNILGQILSVMGIFG